MMSLTQQVLAADVVHHFSQEQIAYLLQERGCSDMIGKLEADQEQRAIRALLGDREKPHTEASSLFTTMFDEFCKEFPTWHSPEAVLFWNALSAATGAAPDQFVVRRIQVTKACFMHAPVALQHYLVVKATGKYNHLQVNIASFVCKHSPSDEFRAYLKSSGGDSFEFFKRVIGKAQNALQHDAIAFNSSSKLNALSAQMIADHLQAHGPALVSKFGLTAEFLSGGRSFNNDNGPIAALSCGFHAMLLIGCYPAEAPVKFLLQNWWQDRELIEVSLEYLRDSGAAIRFITEPVSFPATLSDVVSELIMCETTEGGGCDIGQPEF